MSACDLLTEKEAAAFLNVKQSTIRKWRGIGRISFVKLGACVRFRRSDLDAFIAASVRTAIPQAAIDSEIERLAKEGVPSHPETPSQAATQ